MAKTDRLFYDKIFMSSRCHLDYLLKRIVGTENGEKLISAQIPSFKMYFTSKKSVLEKISRIY